MFVHVPCFFLQDKGFLYQVSMSKRQLAGNPSYATEITQCVWPYRVERLRSKTTWSHFLHPAPRMGTIVWKRHFATHAVSEDHTRPFCLHVDSLPCKISCIYATLPFFCLLKLAVLETVWMKYRCTHHFTVSVLGDATFILSWVACTDKEASRGSSSSCHCSGLLTHSFLREVSIWRLYRSTRTSFRYASESRALVNGQWRHWPIAQCVRYCRKIAHIDVGCPDPYISQKNFARTMFHPLYSDSLSRILFLTR